MTAKIVATTRLPQELLAQVSEVVEDGKKLAMQTIPETRTALIIQAVTAFLPVLRDRIRTERTRLEHTYKTTQTPLWEIKSVSQYLGNIGGAAKDGE